MRPDTGSVPCVRLYRGANTGEHSLPFPVVREGTPGNTGEHSDAQGTLSRMRVMSPREQRAHEKLDRCPWCDAGDEPLPGTEHAKVWAQAYGPQEKDEQDAWTWDDE